MRALIAGGPFGLALNVLIGVAALGCRDRPRHDDGTLTQDRTPRQTAADGLPELRANEGAPSAEAARTGAGTPTEGHAGGPAAGPAPGSERLEPAQIFKVLELAHNGEIEQGRLALGTARSAEVRQFAHMMIRDHTQALEKGTQLAARLSLQPAADHPLAAEVQREGAAAMAALRERRGADFDRAYVRAQVEQHQSLLTRIDARLRPSAEGELALHLDEMRAAVQHHLAEAQTLQGRVASR